jgi:cation:H+ antiporter
MTYVLGFLGSGFVVVLAGAALARFADVIAEVTKLGRLWIGSVVLAGATSLPELTTDISAVRMGAPDLAVGDLFGSSLANMLILALIDLMPPRRRVLQQATLDHALAASLAISINALAAVLVFVRPKWTFLGVSPGTVALFFAYIAGTRAIYRQALRNETGVVAAAIPAGTKEPLRLRRAIMGFTVAALAVLAAAPVFAWSAKGIAAISGLGNTFIGTWLVGLATSLPELVASIAAIRMGAFDLAVGNLFGSNAFNIAIFLPLDAVQPGSLFAVLDPSHALSGLFAVVLMSLGLAAITYRAKHRFAMLEPDSLLMVAAYGVAIWLLFRHSAVPLPSPP